MLGPQLPQARGRRRELPARRHRRVLALNHEDALPTVHVQANIVLPIGLPSLLQWGSVTDNPMVRCEPYRSSGMAACVFIDTNPDVRSPFAQSRYFR